MVVGKIQLPTGIPKADLVITIFAFIMTIASDYVYNMTFYHPSLSLAMIAVRFSNKFNCYHIFRVVDICRTDVVGLIYTT